jgi:Arc/MetJ-type ribon-helix-helix transcriptional regulator
MANTTVKISLSTSLRSTLQQLTKKNQYSTVSGFVQQLIRQEDILEQEKEKLRKMIKVGIESGVSDIKPDVFFDKLEREIQAK